MIFFIKDDKLSKNIMIFEIKLVIVLKQNLIANPSSIKFFWKSKKGLMMMGIQIFNCKNA